MHYLYHIILHNVYNDIDMCIDHISIFGKQLEDVNLTADLHNSLTGITL